MSRWLWSRLPWLTITPYGAPRRAGRVLKEREGLWSRATSLPLRCRGFAHFVGEQATIHEVCVGIERTHRV